MRYAALLRILVLLALVAVLEALCRTGYITNFTMQPPTRIVQDLGKILVSGKLNHAIAKTLTNAVHIFAVNESLVCEVREQCAERDRQR